MKPHWKIVKKQIGLLHVAKADLIARGVLDEAGYRELLGQFRSGDKPVASSKELNNAQFDELMEHFKKCGFVYRPKVKNSSRFKVDGLVKSRNSGKMPL